jgi:DNA-binding NarL/FixJ family response regulator
LGEALVANFDPKANLVPHERLSQREFEVLRLLASGKAVSEVAEMLSLSDKTVSTYRSRILEKLQLKTTADLVRYALEHSLIE